jgi:hypothetical protein
MGERQEGLDQVSARIIVVPSTCTVYSRPAKEEIGRYVVSLSDLGGMIGRPLG